MTSHPHRSGRRSRRRPLTRARSARPSRGRELPGPAPLDVSVEQRATVALLHLAGEFDLCGVDRVQQALDGAIGRRPAHVVFDLRNVSFLDVCGLGTLLRADARAAGEAFAVHVVPPPGVAARIFTLVDAGAGLDLLDDLPR